MNDWKQWLADAVAGLVAAVIVDLNAWTKSTGAFDWSLALKRWLAGAAVGAMGGSAAGGLLGNL